MLNRPLVDRRCHEKQVERALDLRTELLVGVRAPANDKSGLLGRFPQSVDIGFQQFGVSRIPAALECETRLEQGSRGHEFIVVGPSQEALQGIGRFEVVAALEID